MIAQTIKTYSDQNAEKGTTKYIQREMNANVHPTVGKQQGPNEKQISVLDVLSKS